MHTRTIKAGFYFFALVSFVLAWVVFDKGRNHPRLFAGENLDPAVISKISGLNGNFDKEFDAFTVTLDRPGLNTAIHGMNVPADFGMQVKATLTGTPAQTILLGDLPLKEWEVNPIIGAVLEKGLVVSAIHNRFLMDSGRIMSLHFEGRGTQDAMSSALGAIVNALPKDIRNPDKSPSHLSNLLKSRLDPNLMEKVIWKGTSVNGVYRVHLGRSTTLNGKNLGASTGADSWAEFVGTPQTAVVNGEIASIEFELPYVLKDLIKAGIQITSIHTHMTQEKPKLIFVHFWGEGKLESVAAGVKAAIWEKESFQSQ